MTTEEIAQKLVDYCRKGDWQSAYDELYSKNCVSIEPGGGPWPERVEGMDAIYEKGKAWNEMSEEVYGVEVSEPVVCGDQFSLGMTIDVKFKEGPRSKNSEICVYEVREGKITKEQFFYPVN